MKAKEPDYGVRDSLRDRVLVHLHQAERIVRGGHIESAPWPAPVMNLRRPMQAVIWSLQPEGYTL
jgi:hypothetical protein